MKLNSEKCKTMLVPTVRCLREAAERASPSELPVALGVIAVLLDAGDVPEDAWAEPLVEAAALPCISLHATGKLEKS